MEYYLGLELLRPLLLWIARTSRGETPGKRAGGVLRNWLPYLSMLLLFLTYRLAVFPRLLSVPDPNAPALLETIRSQPLGTLVQLAQLGLQDFVHAVLFAWANTAAPETILLSSEFTLASWVFGLSLAVIILAVMLYSGSTASRLDKPSSDSFLSRVLPLGVFAALLGGLPVWITNRQAIVGRWSDRFTLAMIPGVVLLLVWLLAWLDRRTWRRSAVLATLLGLAIATQFRTAHQYSKSWEVQRDFYWQLSWRVPALQPETIFVARRCLSITLQITPSDSPSTVFTPKNQTR